MRPLHAAMLALVASSLLSGSIAAAEDGLVLIRGKPGERERVMVVAAIETVARKAGWSLSSKPLARRDSEALLTCSDSKAPWSCWPASLRAVRHLFVIGVQDSQSDTGAPMIVISGKAIATGQRAVVVGQRYCEHCADDKLSAASTDLASQMLLDLAVQSGRTMASIQSNPPGAQIMFDGERVGATNATFATYPGTHTVVLEKAGFLLEVREFKVEEGKTAELTIDMRPAVDEVPVPRPSRVPPALVIAAGGTLLVTGGFLVLLDEDVNQTGAQPDRYFDSAVPGVASMFVGAALAVGGTYWWMRRSRAAMQSSPSTPVVIVSPTETILGWTGRF